MIINNEIPWLVRCYSLLDRAANARRWLCVCVSLCASLYLVLDHTSILPAGLSLSVYLSVCSYVRIPFYYYQSYISVSTTNSSFCATNETSPVRHDRSCQATLREGGGLPIKGILDCRSRMRSPCIFCVQTRGSLDVTRFSKSTISILSIEPLCQLPQRVVY